MAAKLTRLTHKIAMQLPLVAENCTICGSSSRRSVRKLLDTSSYVVDLLCPQQKYSINLDQMDRCIYS